MDLLVDTEWLARNLGARDLVVLDASAHLPDAKRDARGEFQKGHIPGARFLDLASLKDETSPVPNALPSREQLQDRLRSLGVNTDDRIVLYDDSRIRTAARAWFMMHHYGYGKVGILNGGLAKWRSDNRDLETGEVPCATGNIVLKESTGDVRSKADMLANITSRTEQVVDARDAGRFTGTAEDTIHNLPSGHIPGSKNLFFAELYAEDGTFLPVPELAKKFEQAGIDITKPIVTSCGSGVTASVLLFALALTGHSSALYDGSWSEWGADPATPKATGAAG